MLTLRNFQPSAVIENEPTLRVKRYQNAYRDEWNAFVRNARNGLFLFDRNYMEYHKDRFRDHSALIERGGKIVALFPASESGKEIWSHDGLTFGGLVVGTKTGALEMREILVALADYYRRQGFECLMYKAIPYILHQYPTSEDLYALFDLGASLLKRDLTSVVDLSSPLLLSEKNSRKAASCARLGIEVRENGDFTDFWRLLSGLLLDKYDTLPLHTLEEIEMLKSRFPGQIRLWEARKNGSLLAGVVVYDYGLSPKTQYMANSSVGRDVRALDYILTRLMTEVFHDRRYFNFGSSAGVPGPGLNEGLTRYKEMMGGRSVAVDTYKLNLL